MSDFVSGFWFQVDSGTHPVIRVAEQVEYPGGYSHVAGLRVHAELPDRSCGRHAHTPVAWFAYKALNNKE